MKLSSFFFITVFILLIQSCATSVKTDKLCPKIFIHTDEDIELDETEKRLICGDPEVESYKVIPSYQASYMLTGLLQTRGYSHPRFTYEEDLLHVYPEKKSYLKKVVVISESPEDSQKVEKEIMRQFHNEVATPKLLDEVEANALSLLRNISYPCAKLESSFDVNQEELTIKTQGLVPFQYGIIAKEPIEGVTENALARFYPFSAEDYFSEKKLTLAEKRFLRSGIVQGTYFQEKCDLAAKNFSLSQQFIPGNSKTIRFGVGASTEVGPILRASWSNQRSGNMASLLEANLQMSAKEQSIIFTSHRYLWENAPRRSLLTTFEVDREKQNAYEEITAELKPHMQWSRDGASRFWLWSTGPTLIAGSYKTNADDSDTKRIKTGALEGMLQTQSHDYELFDVHPEDGDYLQFNFDFRHPSMGFTDPLLKLDLTYLRLIRLGNLGKGSGILGMKFYGGSTWVPEDVAISTLPPSVKFYGGGSDDVRGFSLNTLPANNGLGGMTKLSFKLEFRKTHVFTPTLESFTFLDTVYFGYRPWELESRRWYSPGTGLRWFSPIGMVQGYIARALSNEVLKDEGNYFYVGLGGVF